MIAYKYNRYLVIVDGKTFANVSDKKTAERIAEQNSGTVEEYTAKETATRRQLEKIAMNTASYDMEIALYHSEKEIRQEIKAMTDRELVEYLEMEYITLDEYIQK